MIKGVGIDIIEVDRIKKAIERNDRFLSRIFTDREISLYISKGSKLTTIAGKFAAKEAVSKALGTGFRDIKWKDIEVLNDEMGKPYVKLHNNAKNIAYSQDISEILITISHTRYNAVAQAIATSTRIE
ncbi:MAG: ACP synthase [Alkaliphilus sp.]|nr:holo-ACP synthase [bacterium AH-315-G05]PHS35959.1 MAG: ACP synthase [Alkaliphilus sp.]